MNDDDDMEGGKDEDGTPELLVPEQAPPHRHRHRHRNNGIATALTGVGAAGGGIGGANRLAPGRT